jgi:hypothetical protein
MGPLLSVRPMQAQECCRGAALICVQDAHLLVRREREEMLEQLQGAHAPLLRLIGRLSPGD